MIDEFLKDCEGAVIAGDADRAFDLASQALQRDLDILDVVDRGFIKGISEVGRLYEEGEYFLPELVMGAEAAKKGLAVLEPALSGSGLRRGAKGVGVIGTIEGDIHDIGKTLVATMLAASGFEVHDLGTGVSPERFLEEADARGAGFIGVSALLTTTMLGQGSLVELLRKKGRREDFIIIVGGAPCSAEWARKIGADGYAPDAVAAVELIEDLAGRRGEEGK